MADTQPDPDQTFTVASELIRARVEAGITQVALAELSGVSRSAIKGYETGRNAPGARELRALCAVLKVSPTRLLFGSDEPAELVSGRELADSMEQPGPDVRSRLAAVGELLSGEEAAALLTVARAIAAARHGEETVKMKGEQAAKTATVYRAVVAEVAQAMQTGKPIDPDRLAKAANRFLKQLRATSKPDR